MKEKMRKNKFTIYTLLILLIVTACDISNPFSPTQTALPTVTACDISNSFSPTQTALPTVTPRATSVPAFHFAAIGDFGVVGKNAQLVAELVHSRNTDFIITLGDNNYPEGSDETIDKNIGQYYADYIYPYKGEYGPGATENRFFPSIGNHDDITDDGLPYLEYFSLPGNERYYQFSWGLADFFAVNSQWDEDGRFSSSIQAEWLKNALANSDAIWKIVYFHSPPYSSGEHGSDEEMQWPFKEWGATIVLTGHDHTYEQLIVDDFPYIVNGLGGRSIYEFGTVVPGSQVRYNDTYGALFAEVSREKISFEFVNVLGETIDQFDVLK